MVETYLLIRSLSLAKTRFVMHQAIRADKKLDNYKAKTTLACKASAPVLEWIIKSNRNIKFRRKCTISFGIQKIQNNKV